MAELVAITALSSGLLAASFPLSAMIILMNAQNGVAERELRSFLVGGCWCRIFSAALPDSWRDYVIGRVDAALDQASVDAQATDASNAEHNKRLAAALTIGCVAYAAVAILMAICIMALSTSVSVARTVAKGSIIYLTSMAATVGYAYLLISNYRANASTLNSKVASAIESSLAQLQK
jgi:hypothetical protein